MIAGLILVLGCQLIGEFLVAALGLRVPGPVVGMLLFLLVLSLLPRLRPGSSGPAERAGDRLLEHLQLFFVPAGVGVIQYLTLLRDHSWPVVAGMVGGWLAALAGTAAVASGVSRLSRAGARRGGRRRTAGTPA